MKWEKVKLSDCCVSIADGDHLPPPKADSGIPFITISNINSTNQLDFSDTMFVPQEYYDKLDSKRKAQIDDILYSVVGSFGIPVYIKDDRNFVFQRHIAILRPNEKINPRFLYYTMLSKAFYAKADAAAIGAAQRTVSLTALRNIEIDLPSIDKQRKIADILSAYDDLIENNQKQIKLLEEAAQRLYKEWFVDLRFPGYENTPVVDGVPQGWRKVSLSELIEYEIGGGWGEDQPTEKCDLPAYVIRGTDLYDVTHGNAKSIPYRFHAKGNLDSRKLQDGDIVFEVSGGSKNEGVARTALITESLIDFLGGDVICASFCKLIRFKDKSSAKYMYDTFQYLRNSGETVKYDKRSASSIVNYRWKDFLEQQFIFIPTSDILTQYNTLAETMQKVIVNKAQIIEQAKQARDRLLPKLMSGELEV